MGLLNDVRAFFYEEEFRFKSAVSEATWSKVGGALNFLRNKTHQEKQFFANGPYWIGGNTQSFVDGLQVFEFDAEIFDVVFFNIGQGSAGYTQADILVKPQTGGSWTSILAVKPHLDATNPTRWIGVGDTAPSGAAAPVLVSPTVNVNRRDAIRMDLTSVQTNGSDMGVLVYYRPR